jgi:DoxX-like family
LFLIEGGLLFIFDSERQTLCTQPPRMIKTRIYTLLTFCIATVWIANGLFCKVLNLVPRHEQIVAKILGSDYSKPLTILIGFSEIIMAIWILSRYKSKLNAIAQILVVATMNTMEFILVPDLLLWGKFNSLFAFLFILVVYFNEFYLNKKQIN